MISLKGVYSALAKLGRGSSAPLGLTGYGSLRMAGVEPELLELARTGRLNVAGTTAVAGGRAPVQDIPTTTANWLLFNPLSSGKLLVPIKAGMFVASGTSDKGSILIGGVTPQKLADAQAVSAQASNHGMASSKGQDNAITAWLGVGATVPTMASSFAVLGGMENAANATPGSGSLFSLGGAFIVPPGFGFALDVLSGAGTTAKFGINILFAALELDVD